MTMNTDTPESDKAKIAFTSLFANDDAYWIPYAIGKKLERERDDICAQLREEQQLHVQTLNERDEARERADTMFAKHAEILDQARRDRDEWKAKYIQQNKDLGCEQMDPNGTIWDYAKKLQAKRDELLAAIRNLSAAIISQNK